MQSLILVVHVLAAICIVTLVLLQHGKGADAGAAFGSGASNTMFGSQGSLPFLMKITVLLAAVFFATSIGLGYLASRQVRGEGRLIKMPANSSSTLPALPAMPSTDGSKK